MDADEVEIRRLNPADAKEQLDALAAVLGDCVAGGASVSYLAPFSHAQARGVFKAFAVDVEQGRRLLLASACGPERYLTERCQTLVFQIRDPGVGPLCVGRTASIGLVRSILDQPGGIVVGNVNPRRERKDRS